jgi:hypothetical protein
MAVGDDTLKRNRMASVRKFRLHRAGDQGDAAPLHALS